MHGGVAGARSADHHQLPHRLAGRVRHAAGHAGHALGRLPGGVCALLCAGIDLLCVCMINDPLIHPQLEAVGTNCR